MTLPEHPDDSQKQLAATRANDAGHSEAVMRLFTQHQRWLFGYLTSLLGNATDAEDVVQEVSVVMWQQHHKFELGTNFVSWLSVIAFRQSQKFWREKKKKDHFLNLDVMQQLAENTPEHFELHEARRRALAECVKKLHANDQVLVASCYGDRNETKKQAAERLGRPAGTVYKALDRIRKSLLDCVNRVVSQEGLA